MDRPKQKVSWLESFPPDIWAYIVWYLPGEQLGRLMMTGATLLWYRLKSPHVVKSIKLGRDFMIFKTFPKFLNDLPSLDELSILNCYDEWRRKIGLTFASIPSGVRKLELAITLGKSSNLSKHLPHLTTLDIICSDVSEYSWMIHSPKTLTSLRLYCWDGSVALPSSLIHFEAEYVDYSEYSEVSTLPHSLESFVAQKLYAVDLIVPLLPPSTRKLDLGRYPKSSSLTKSWHPLFEKLPKFLTYFAVPFDVNFVTYPELMSLLPTTLTELVVHPNLPCSVWPLLPPSLTKLSTPAPTPLPTVSIVDAVGIQREFESIPFDLLPRSLTRLYLVILGVHLCGPPTTSIQSYFPPNLTHLKLSDPCDSTSLHLSPEVVKLLPSSLTYLEMANLCEQVCEYLPTGLKTLTSRGTLLSPKLINFLPKSLTFLRLYISYTSYVWFDYNTGQRLDPISKHPNYSSYKKCLSSNFDWKQTSPLPSTLRYLEVSVAVRNLPNELGDSFVQHLQLPNLLELRMLYLRSLTDLSIPMLPRHLITLDLQSSSMVSGKSFEFLPRCLIELNLDSSESIFDSDIEHLPRTLKRLYLRHAIHLTELCIADLPSHLETLLMSFNSQIPSSSFHKFPYSLRSYVPGSNLSFEKWSAGNGKIWEPK